MSPEQAKMEVAGIQEKATVEWLKMIREIEFPEEVPADTMYAFQQCFEAGFVKGVSCGMDLVQGQ